ncbi:MAG: hypothetical protein ACF8GE_06955 [Phycisphaerales bacterium JB043]
MHLTGRVLIAVLAALLLACHTMGDTIYLKDGSVLEGTITREEASFLFIEVTVGGITDEQLVMRDDIERIERDTPAVEAPREPERAPSVSETSPSEEARKPEHQVSENATRLSFVSLEGTVGPYMNAQALAESIRRIEDQEPDIIVLEVDSGGGFGLEIQPIANLIERRLKPKYRVIVWVDSAISAAAMSTLACEEIYFQSKGNFGAATGYRGAGDAIEGEELELMLRQMEEISAWGNHDPLIMRAMQIGMDLSCDIDEDGRVTWREDLNGEYIVSTEDRILTLNALDAVRYKFARGIADTKEELAATLGADEWVEVGHEADEYQRDFRENVGRGEVESAKVLVLFDEALKRGQVGQAQRYLGQLRSWARRAPSLVQYGSEQGTPPMNRQFFRQLEESLAKVRKQVAQNRRR